LSRSISTIFLRSISGQKWDDGHLELLLDLWEEKYFEYNRLLLSPKNWREILLKLMARFLGQVHCRWKVCRDKIAKIRTTYRN
jgi:hypothetical protein